MEVQHQFGAIRGSDLLKGEWWRLIACCFVHFGLVHLAANMLSLYAVGPFLEIRWGRIRFLLLYLLSGLAGSCAVVIFTPAVEGAGASGAILGVFASLLPWILLNRRYLSRGRSLLRNVLVVIALNVVISMLPGISAAAHYGGGGAGILAGAALNEQRFGSGMLRWLAGLLVPLMPVVCVATVVQQMSGPAWEQMDLRQRQEIAESEESEAAKLGRSQLMPLNNQPLKTISADKLRQIVSVYQSIRNQLGKAQEAFNVAYRSPKVEEERAALVGEIDKKKRFFEQEEFHVFLLPAANNALAKAAKAMAPLEEGGLRLLGPRVFPPGATENLTKAGQELVNAAALLREAGSFEDTRIEEMRLAKLEVLDTWSTLLDFTAGFLKKGEDWKQVSLDEFSRLERACVAAGKRWSNASKNSGFN
jgi:membrane associated rhomboid family serine protease